MQGLILVSLMINSQIRSPEKLQDVAKFPKSWSKEWAEWWVASAWSKTRAGKCLSAVLMPVTHLEVFIDDQVLRKMPDIKCTMIEAKSEARCSFCSSSDHPHPTVMWVAGKTHVECLSRWSWRTSDASVLKLHHQLKLPSSSTGIPLNAKPHITLKTCLFLHLATDH